jgi:hypothetical protein
VRKARLLVPPAGDPDTIPAGPGGAPHAQEVKWLPPCSMGSVLSASGTSFIYIYTRTQCETELVAI